ncbi:MAG TPA: flagellar assembly protein FliW [Bacilli bacterium]
MKLNTLRFGEIETEDEDIIRFPNGIPGFEKLTQFIMIKTDEDLPFSYMQSVDDGDISFIATNPFDFYPNYEFQLSEEVKQELRIQNEEDVMIWSIVSIKEEIVKATLNLLAPVVLNVREGLGKQVILSGTSYQTKHNLISEAALVSTNQSASKEEDPC